MGMVIASTRSGGGVGLRGHGVQLLGYRGLLMVALLFVTTITFVIKDVHCSITTDAVAPAPTPSTQPIVTFNQFEAEAMNAVFQKWSKKNPQLSTLLEWSPDKHPCYILTADFEETAGNSFQGAWSGVGCTSVLQDFTEIPRHYHISVTSLQLCGSNYSCEDPFCPNQCGFDGIIGQLPPEISNLTNLKNISIAQNPNLTGPVPVELFRMPNLITLSLNNNSLSGTLPSNVSNPDCKLQWIDLSRNNFSGTLPLSSQGTLFCSTLNHLSLNDNSFSGKLPSNVSNPDCKLQLIDLSRNNFSGTLPLSSQGNLFCSTLNSLLLKGNSLSGSLPSIISNPDCQLERIDLGFNNFSGGLQVGSQGTLFCSTLNYLWLGNNSLSGTLPSDVYNPDCKLQELDLSQNNFSGTLPLSPQKTLFCSTLNSLNTSPKNKKEPI